MFLSLMILVHSAYRERNAAAGRHPGHQTYMITYNDLMGESFDWLHINFEDLSLHASRAGWHADLIDSEMNGHYLCRLTKIQA